MEAIVPTFYGVKLYNSLLLGEPYLFEQYTTINEALSINSTFLTPGQAFTPTLNYIAIGNGGHRFVLGNSGNGKPQVVQHSSADANLYNILPFVMRPQNNDLTPAEQANYALKTSRTIANVAYFLYYLKVINSSSLTSQDSINTISNNNVISTPFTPTISNLYPTPPVINNNQPSRVAREYLKSASSVSFTLSASEIQDFLQVVQLLPEANNTPIISEMALCSGMFDSTLGDVVGVQPNTFLSVFFPVPFNIGSLNYSFSLGNTRPLYQLTPEGTIA